VFGDGTVSRPNPIGEKVYHTHLLADMLPIAIIACGFLLTWLLNGASGLGDECEVPVEVLVDRKPMFTAEQLRPVIAKLDEVCRVLEF